MYVTISDTGQLPRNNDTDQDKVCRYRNTGNFTPVTLFFFSKVEINSVLKCSYIIFVNSYWSSKKFSYYKLSCSGVKIKHSQIPLQLVYKRLCSDHSLINKHYTNVVGLRNLSPHCIIKSSYLKNTRTKISKIYFNFMKFVFKNTLHT